MVLLLISFHFIIINDAHFPPRFLFDFPYASLNLNGILYLLSLFITLFNLWLSVQISALVFSRLDFIPSRISLFNPGLIICT